MSRFLFLNITLCLSQFLWHSDSNNHYHYHLQLLNTPYIWLPSLCCWNSILLKSSSLPTLSPEPEQVNLDEGKSKIRSAGLPYFTLMTISESCSVVSDSLQPHGLYSPWNSPGQNTGVGNLSLLQGIFPTQGSNPGLPHCRQILYQLSYKWSSRILEWVVYPFSRRSSQPRNWTRVSCIADGFSINWTTRDHEPSLNTFWES